LIVKCRQCGELIFFKDEQAGQTAPCTVCHSPILLPSKKIILPPEETADIEPAKTEPEKEGETAPADDNLDEIPPQEIPEQKGAPSHLPPTFITAPLPPPRMEPEIPLPEDELAGIIPRSEVVLELKSPDALKTEETDKPPPPPMAPCPFCSALLNIPVDPRIVKFPCPKCNKPLTLLRSLKGARVAPATQIQESPIIYAGEGVCICGLCKKPVEVSNADERQITCLHCMSRLSVPQRVTCPDCDGRNTVFKIPRKALILAGIASEPKGPYYHCNSCGRKFAIQFPSAL